MSQTVPPPASATHQLRIGATFSESHSLVFNRLGSLLKAAAIPYLMTMVLTVFVAMAQSNPGLVLLTTILLVVPYTLFGVAWHRLTLLGPGASALRVTPIWKRHHWRFLGYALVVTVIGSGLLMGLVLLGALIALPMSMSGTFSSESAGSLFLIVAAAAIAALGFVYLLVRLSFVFPAVAVGEAYGLKHAWTHTRGQGFRLVGLVILTALPISFVSWLLQLVLSFLVFGRTIFPAATGDSPDATVAEKFVPLIVLHGTSNLFNYLLTAVVVTAISIAFRSCSGWVPAGGGGAPGGESNAG